MASLAVGGVVVLLGAAGALRAQEPGVAAAERCEGPGDLPVSGTVVDRQTGLALPAARVRLEFTAGPAGEAPPEVTAAEDGSFVACAPPGAEQARLLARWGEGQSDGVEVAPPASDVRLAVELGEPTFLLFSVFEAETERPVAGAAVRLRPLPLLSLTDSLGRAVFRRVPPAGYEVAVSHLAYHPTVDSVAAERGRGAELRVPLTPRAIPLEPLRVTVTGRDPYLVDVGFYDRRRNLREGYWGLPEEIRPYRLLSTLLQFKRELFIRFRPGIILVNGRPMERLGYRRVDEIPLHRIRGLEAIRCGELPPRYLRYVGRSMDCNALLLWVR